MIGRALEEVLKNDDEKELGMLLPDSHTVLGLSDAGAHMHQICDACCSSYLLGHRVRDLDAIDLEMAECRLTGHPGERFGFRSRDFIRPGHGSDLVGACR
jgi:N-acyl-D-aspartate/D-glutamate deacylase